MCARKHISLAACVSSLTGPHGLALSIRARCLLRSDSSFVGAGKLVNWHNTFSMFDRDGGGDIDHREIGLLFRQLGYTPSDAEIRALVYEADSDDNGSIDFEEFCLLMPRRS